MQYVKDELVVDRKGKPAVYSDVEEEVKVQKELMWGKAVSLLFANYMPNQELHLTPAEIRSKDKVLNVIEDDGVDEDGYFAFEDAHFPVVKKAIPYLASVNMWLANFTPSIEDTLNAAVTKKPDKVEAAKDAAVEAKPKKKGK